VIAGFLGVGFCFYTIYKIAEAIFNPEDEKWHKRVGYFFAALLNIVFIAYAFQIAARTGAKADTVDAWSHRLLSTTGGRVLLGFVGFGIILGGLIQFYRAVTADFMKHFSGSNISHHLRTVIKWIGRVGIFAQGMTFLLLGIFVFASAVHGASNEIYSFGGLFVWVASQQFGRVLLGILGLGLVCYAVYAFARCIWDPFEVTEEQLDEPRKMFKRLSHKLKGSGDQSPSVNPTGERQHLVSGPWSEGRSSTSSV